MVQKRVTAFFMHETERDAALPFFTAPQVTDSFVYGDVDDKTLTALQDAGLVVQPEVAPLPDPEDDAMSSAKPASGGLSALEAVADPADEGTPAPVDYYRVTVRGPLIDERRQQLEQINVRFLEKMGIRRYKARLTSVQVGAVAALPFVQRVEWLTPSRSAARRMTRATAVGDSAAAKAAVSTLKFDIRLHVPEGRASVEQWLVDHGVTIVGSSGRKIRIQSPEDSPSLVELRHLSEVDKVVEHVPPKLFNDFARRLLAVDAAPGSTPPTVIAEDGTGQIVAVADTGIDDTHPDFAGRIVGKVDRGRPGVTDDPHGHGTHVAGSVLGDGSASGGRIKGVAPGAQLYFQSLLDAAGELGGLPVDLNELFGQAYAAGARIHNNSWGSATASTYTINSEEVDEFVRAHPDMLVVIAAGNEGVGSDNKNADKGFVDWLSIGSPASCKNALTVGASRTNRPNGALGAKTWGTGWPDRFPHSPISGQAVSGDPEALAAFSSRGPCDDFRIKPDVVAPGTDILSTKSALAPISNFWGPHGAAGPAADPHYAYDGGTSMAAPLVAGCAALVRQYYVQTRAHQPSAALLKATLINGTQWLTASDADAPAAGVPNYHQGHGRVCMEQTIPNVTRPGFALQFVDNWQDAGSQLTRTGERRRYQFVLGAPASLRFCLCYTDAPARGLQNNLNLMVQHVEGKRKWMGNEKLPAAIVHPDPTNNVETITIPGAAAGTYIVQVFAGNMLTPPQDFALVVTGVGVPNLVQI